MRAANDGWREVEDDQAGDGKKIHEVALPRNCIVHLEAIEMTKTSINKKPATFSEKL